MAYGSLAIDQITTSVPNVSLGAGNASIMKNRIINGAMVIDQRYAGTAYTSSNANTYVLDRWQSLETGGVNGKYTIQQNAGSVTPPVGFSNYLGITSQSAFSITSGIIQTVCQKIEGFNTSDLAWGTANAKTVTISFWAYSSLTGTFGGVVNNSAFNYSYPFTYSIPTANTWTQISVNISGPTTGTWVGGTNGTGLVLQFVIGTGSTYQGTAGSWSANGWYGVTGAVNVTGTSGATLYITGVQLEVGSSATGFEYRQYGQELALCQRYLPAFNLSTGNSIGVASGYNSLNAFTTLPFPVATRTAPTGVSTTGAFYLVTTTVTITTSTASLAGATTLSGELQLITFTSGSPSGGVSYPLRGYANPTQILFTGCEL